MTKRTPQTNAEKLAQNNALADLAGAILLRVRSEGMDLTPEARNVLQSLASAGFASPDVMRKAG